MKKIKIDELLRLACIYAESDRQEFLRCIEHTDMKEEIQETEAFLKQLVAYRKKRWGKTPLEKIIDSPNNISVPMVPMPESLKALAVKAEADRVVGNNPTTPWCI